MLPVNACARGVIVRSRVYGRTRKSGGEGEPNTSHINPVTDRILAGSRTDRSLFVLLTTLMQAGDPKLLQAAEMSLRSLVKQSRQATVP